MIVQRYLQWVKTAPEWDRAEAANALGRAYVQSALSDEDRRLAEAAMTTLLDDPSRRVRRALADAIAASPRLPHHIALALCDDVAEVAGPVLSLSPVLGLADLVDYSASQDSRIQCAIAARSPLPAPVAAAIAEVGSAEACSLMVRNRDAQLTPPIIERLIERHIRDMEVREGLLSLPNLSVGLQQKILKAVADTLVGLISDREMSHQHARTIAGEACEKATVVLAAEWVGRPEMVTLVGHLRESGQLTTALLLRAVADGNLDFFETSLSELSGLPRSRVSRLVRDRHSHGLDTLYRRVGLPEAAQAAFRGAMDELVDADTAEDDAARLRFSHRVARRMLDMHMASGADELDGIATLLRSILADASRNEARQIAHMVASKPRLAAA